VTKNFLFSCETGCQHFICPCFYEHTPLNLHHSSPAMEVTLSSAASASTLKNANVFATEQDFQAIG